MVVADFDKGGVQPQERISTLELALSEALDLSVQLLAQPTDVASEDAIQTKCLDQVVDPARTDALDLRLAHQLRESSARASLPMSRSGPRR